MHIIRNIRELDTYWTRSRKFLNFANVVCWALLELTHQAINAYDGKEESNFSGSFPGQCSVQWAV
jgi:hypothetical protein